MIAGVRRWLPVVLATLLPAVVAFHARVDTSSGDARGALLTAQAICEHGTLKLDAYRDTIEDNPEAYQYRVRRKGHHLYYFFPLGTPLLSAPFVAIANGMGMDMRSLRDDARLQNLLSVLTMALAGLLIYVLARVWVSPVKALLLLLPFLFGSPLASTLGTGLWSSNWAVVFTLCGTLLLCRAAVLEARPRPFLLAAALFCAYLCKPSAAIMSVVALGMLFVMHWRQAIKFAVAMAALLAGFALFSRHEFGQWLPDYYSPFRLSAGSGALLQGIYGNLLSPSRGILVSCSYLLAMCMGSVILFRRLRSQPLFWGAWAWIGLHLLSISKFYKWWGGWSFGSRLFVEAFPAWILLSLLVLTEAKLRFKQARYRVWIGYVVISAMISVFINTAQGLYNEKTAAWNASPNIDEHPELLFSWRFPQWLATPASLAARAAQLRLASCPMRDLNASVRADSADVVFESWSGTGESATGPYRWSIGKRARIWMVPSQGSPVSVSGTLHITAGTFGRQRIRVLFNGRHLGVIEGAYPTPETFGFELHDTVVESPLSVTFLTPDATSPAQVGQSRDDRKLGLSLYGMTLMPTDR